ncbi:flagellar protein FlgN [Nordella sp. HKS 07]|uniref:flagellar protein FlgN n=1 Tax=Nordella sp. HKS 07 TaxID=2712222 RepID=UPI0013E15BC3|nr:flagellar protein FlgN [Nordella sp. HKS 07]QIG49911.1 flagellar protein FlgN [Nordella sp. HKS 07]
MPSVSPLSGALNEVVERIGAIIEAETEALRERRVVDLQEFNNRKSRGLLDLMRAVRALDGGRPDAGTAVRLEALRTKLAANQAALSVHLAAAREITTLVAQTIRDGESDGTYSNSLSARDKSPW